MSEQLILVDQYDNAIGVAEKYIAHQTALRHRAFSVFVFDKRKEKNKILLQHRHHDKYHSGDLWSNTCCGHPRPHEDLLQGAKRRLQEEMGMSIALARVGVFHYKVSLQSGLIENEIDHVCVGFYQGETIQFDPKEISDFAWVEIEALVLALKNNPNHYTSWLKPALDIAMKAL